MVVAQPGNRVPLADSTPPVGSTPPASPAPPDAHFPWPAVLVAGASVALWLAALTVAQPRYIADEWRHYEVIEGLLHGRWPSAGQLPMPPTYHLLAAGVCRLFGFSMLTIRALNAVLALATIGLLAAALRRLRPEAPAAGVLLLAWNPLLLPYLALGYTEVAGLLALAAALLLHVRGRLAASAGVLLAACLVRQSNIVWVAFFAAWAAISAWPAHGGPATPARLAGFLWRTALPRLWLHVGLLLLAAGWFVTNPAFAVGLEHAHRPGVNRAQFYLFGLTVAVLWAPLWAEHLARTWRRRLMPWLARGWVVALLLGAVGLLELLYANPHPWNDSDLFLRNRLLRLLTVSLPARLAAAAALVVVAVAVVTFVRTRPRHAPAALAWLFGLLYVAPHWLVDPRYYILPAVFVNVCTDFSGEQSRRLVAWHALLSLATCAYILVHGSPDGGVL